jgi:hypothetical protein
MTSWWLGLADAEAIVPCGEHEHRLRWHRGQLQALDHGDPVDERALAALGGDPFPCIELFDAWERHRADLHVLTLGSRGPIDPLRIDPDALSPGGGSRPLGRPRPMAAGRGSATIMLGGAARGPRGGRVSAVARDESELVQLLSLEGGLQDRLQATVAASWARRLRSGHRQVTRSRPQLHAALHGRVLAALSAWQGGTGAGLEVTMIDEDAPRSLTLIDGRIHAELPFAWLVEVWARGLATVFGRFCLTADTSSGRRWTLTTVGPDMGELATIVVTLPGGVR